MSHVLAIKYIAPLPRCTRRFHRTTKPFERGSTPGPMAEEAKNLASAVADLTASETTDTSKRPFVSR